MAEQLEYTDRVKPGKQAAPTLADLFPEPVSCVFSAAVPAATSLPPAEAELLDSMASARRRSFIQGRSCARRALQSLGIQASVIGVGSGRQPLWPKGIVGSISHKAEQAAAAVALRSQFVSLGLDIEPLTVLEPGVIRLISRNDERQDPAWSDYLDGAAWSVMFSIKESIYKCLWPRLERYIDFQDVHVTLDRENGRFSAQSRSAKVPCALANSLAGRYRIKGGVVVTSAWIRA